MTSGPQDNGDRNRSGGRPSGPRRGGPTGRGPSRPPFRRGDRGRDPRDSRDPRPAGDRNGPGRPGTEAPAGPPPAQAAVAPAQDALPKRDPVLQRQTMALSLSAWDLARSRPQGQDSPRGHMITMRNQVRLVGSFEKERRIPPDDQSFLRIKEDAKGSVLLIHGVSTGPGDLRELGQRLFDAGFNVHGMRLPDYGRPGHTISEVSWEAALNQVLQYHGRLARGGGLIHVVGLGFGATLALLLARQEKVASLVLLAPAIMPFESLFQRLLVRLKLHRFRFMNRRLGWNAGLMEGMDRARGRVGQIPAPIYAAQCDDDDRASPESLRFLQRKARHPASRFQVFPEGGHAVLAAHGEAVLYREIVKFIADGD
ncbi:alpha/beta fold hydrolase [bacterium]|nr:alpha/beta fold hydrolase [bacterium]